MGTFVAGRGSVQAGLEPRAGLTPTPGSHGGVSWPPCPGCPLASAPL